MAVTGIQEDRSFQDVVDIINQYANSYRIPTPPPQPPLFDTFELCTEETDRGLMVVYKMISKQKKKNDYEFPIR